jgi:hypothetical protein
VTHEAIAIRAHQLFEQQGRVHGHDIEHWLTAERELSESPRPAPAVRKAAGKGAKTQPPIVTS